MQQPQVSIASGRLRGRELESGGAAFLGIPYAEPAVGPDRFALPRPRQAWDGVREATEHGPTALQAPYPAPMEGILPNSVSPGEDYLNVSVWTPDPGASGLPVLVWIHGGAFVRGANSIASYDGSAFARDGVVVFGINYRLGIAGFPVLPDAPTNLALRDQLFALQWVQDNVAAFGGDPANVTVMGESAGGMSVATLLAMPAARGLFRQAIIQSGGGISAGDPSDLSTVSAQIARELGVPATAAALAAVDPADLLEAQNAATLALITDPRPGRWGASTLRAGFGIMPTFPAIDGDLLPDLPERLIAQGSSHQVPLLIGSNTQEFNLWSIGLGSGAHLTAETLPVVLDGLGAPEPVVTSYASRRGDLAPGQVFSDVMTDLLFRQPAIRIAQSRAQSDGEPNAESVADPTYAYEFDWATDQHGLGACHALELPFVFDTLASGHHSMSGPNAPQPLADRMHAAWVAFVTHGDPGWAAYDTERRQTRRFAVDGPELVDDPRGADRRSWGDIGARG